MSTRLVLVNIIRAAIILALCFELTIISAFIY